MYRRRLPVVSPLRRFRSGFPFGLRVSRDIHVVSVGNEDCLPADATLSASVALPIPEIGHAAVEMALAQVAERAEPEVRLISPRLVTRDGDVFGGAKQFVTF